jgi:L-arabinose isomerase
VGRRVREVVPEEEVVVAAASSGRAVVPVERLAPREPEDPVAALRDRVLGDHVVAVLLEEEEARRVLAAVVDAVDVAADAAVERVARDRHATAPPHRESPPRKPRGVSVEDARIGDGRRG